MAMKSPETVAQKWANNLAQSTESIKAGVMATTQNPAEKAANSQDRWLAGVQRAASEGRFAGGLRKVTLQQWQQSMIQKGVNRIASGATEAKPKMAAFMAKWLPYMDSLKQQLSQMPRGDLEANIARANFAMRYNAAFKGS